MRSVFFAWRARQPLARHQELWGVLDRCLGTAAVRSRNPLRVALAAVAVSAVLCSSQVVAAEPAEGADNQPLIVYTTGDGPAFASSDAASRLTDFVTRKGRARVIVGLRLTMRMEHTLGAQQAASQRQALSAAQDRVVQRVLGLGGGAGVTRFTFIPFISLYVTPPQLARLLADPDVASVERDLDFAPEAASASQKQTHVPYVWDKGFGGTDYVVAVLDSGVHRQHEMFKGKVVSEACYGTTDAGEAITSDCPGGAASATGNGAAAPCAPNIDGCEHGSHVASIAVGNGPALDGVARDAKLIAVKVVSMFNDGTAYTIKANDVVAALERVYNLRDKYTIAAVNMSFGIPGFAQQNAACDGDSAALTTALGNLRAAGIAPLKSSGNNSLNAGVTFPGCISTVIAVGNVTSADVARRSSNHSPLVKLMAPGTNIKGAVPPNSTCLEGGEKKYCLETGTSQASPFVAGSIALLRNAKKTASLDDVLTALTCSGRMIDKREVQGGSPVDITPARPRVDLEGAFNFLKKPKNAERSWAFDDADELRDWTPFRGVWKVNGGMYRPTISPIWVETSVANCDTRLEVTARMKRVDPTPENPDDPTTNSTAWNSGIWLKTTLNYDTDEVSGYFFAFNKLPYCTVTPPAGQKCKPAQIKRGQGLIYRINRSNANTGTAQAGSVRLCFKNMPVEVSGLNTLRAVSDGAKQTLYVNGKLACTVNDTTYLSGPVMLAAASPCAPSPATCPTPTPGHSFQVDSVSVKPITGAGKVASSAAVMNVSALEEELSRGPGANPAFSTSEAIVPRASDSRLSLR